MMCMQYVGGDALRKSIKLPLGIRVILNVITLVLFSNLRVGGSLILKDLLEPSVINKIMRTGGSLRGLQ